jgi:hypothetical protein
MRLKIRTLATASLLAGWIPAGARAQTPPPAPPPTPEPASPAPVDLAAPPAPTPTPSTSPALLRIVEAPAISVEMLPSENPYGATVAVPAALPPKLPFTKAAISIGFFVSIHVDPTGKALMARRERDPIPSLAGETLKSLQRWTFTPARRSGQAVETWGAYRLDLYVEIDAPRILQQTLSPVTAATPLPAPFQWPADADWLDGRRPATPPDGSVSILEVDTAPIPQKTPWSADSFKGPFSVKFWVKVDRAGRIEKAIPIEVSDPVLLPYFRRAMGGWTLRPAQAGGSAVESWNELSLSGQIAFDDEIKQVAALRRAIGP